MSLTSVDLTNPMELPIVNDSASEVIVSVRTTDND